MSSSSHVLRSAAFVAVLVVLPALSACTGFTPVYGENGLGNQRVEVAYGHPVNRLEQIVYQDLALKLGKSDQTSGVPVVDVAITAKLPTTDTTSATTTVEQRQVTVTAIVSVVGADGTALFTGTRSVVEDFVKGGQVFANQQAAKDAAERGAHELAETIRLQVIAALLKK